MPKVIRNGSAEPVIVETPDTVVQGEAREGHELLKQINNCILLVVSITHSCGYYNPGRLIPLHLSSDPRHNTTLQSQAVIGLNVS